MNYRRRLTIKLVADAGAPFVVMFEPSGMTYDLAGGEYMYAEVVDSSEHQLEIVNWFGGISVWASGALITLDADGNELHRLN